MIHLDNLTPVRNVAVFLQQEEKVFRQKRTQKEAMDLGHTNWLILEEIYHVKCAIAQKLLEKVSERLKEKLKKVLEDLQKEYLEEGDRIYEDVRISFTYRLRKRLWTIISSPFDAFHRSMFFQVWMDMDEYDAIWSDCIKDLPKDASANLDQARKELLEKKKEVAKEVAKHSAKMKKLKEAKLHAETLKKSDYNAIFRDGYP